MRYREPHRRADPAVSFPLDGSATLSPCRHFFKRYTRLPSRSNERTLRLCFDRLREMKPRTVWACQPVWLRISFSVAPSGRHNRVDLVFGAAHALLTENTGNGGSRNEQTKTAKDHL